METFKEYYLISGLRPAYGKKVNQFLAALDLDITGAFYHFEEVATVAVDVSTTKTAQDRMDGIKWAYEQQGHVDVEIKQITQDEAERM